MSKRTAFIEAATKVLGSLRTVTRQEIINICEKKSVTFPQWITNDPEFRAGRGEYDLKAAAESLSENSKATSKNVVNKKARRSNSNKKTVAPAEPAVAATVPVVTSAVPAVEHNDAKLAQIGMSAEAVESALAGLHNQLSLVPETAVGYVPFGYYNDVRDVIRSGMFYPIYITGLSGNGKTMMVEQVCASEGRECVRTNIVGDTDEDDLLGGFRLINGQTVWQNGPVIIAMERGAVLLLDEVDLGSSKLMCLQPVLEGRPIYLKKINKVVYPRPGFNIIATANTKGKGSEDGRFIGTNVMNEAFLERFSVTIEQEYPPMKTEEKILANVMEKNGLTSENTGKFVKNLVSWADIIRRSFFDGACNEIISTRRLVHICEAFAIFRNQEKAIKMCLNRFDNDTRETFTMFWQKLTEEPAAVDPNIPAPPANYSDPEF